MRNIILTFFLITSIYASDDKKAAGIFNFIIKEVTNKENSNVYLHTTVSSIEQYPGNLKIVTKCQDADIVILSSATNLPKECQKRFFLDPDILIWKIQMSSEHFSGKKDVQISFFIKKG